eukprot:PITA_27817
MEHLPQKVSRARVMSFLDGFSGYNQIVVHTEDQEKTTFTTPWGTFIQFEILVNPKNSQFALEEGKLLGHIVFVEGVKIDPARVQAIQTLSIPRSKRDIQSFPGKINFVRRFIPNFAEILKHITSMLKKGSEKKWIDAARSSFEAIKQDIMKAPTLINLDYAKEFCIFSFASYDTLAIVLLQKNDEGIEHPVSFFSKTLRDAELRC